MDYKAILDLRLDTLTSCIMDATSKEAANNRYNETIGMIGFAWSIGVISSEQHMMYLDNLITTLAKKAVVEGWL